MIPTILDVSVPTTAQLGPKHGHVEKPSRSPPSPNLSQQLLKLHWAFFKSSPTRFMSTFQQSRVLTAEKQVAPFYH